MPKCTPNNSRLDSSKLLNTVPLETPVCFLFSACSQGNTGLQAAERRAWDSVVGRFFGQQHGLGIGAIA